MRVLPLALFTILSAPAVAAAQTAPAPAGVAVESPTARVHDGFYLRLGGGFGSHYQTINMVGHDPGVTVSGVSSVGEFALGYAWRPGWVFGVGSYSGTLESVSRTYHTDQPMPPSDILNDVKDFNVFGLFCDHYFGARAGLHMEGALGVATVRGISFADARFDGKNALVGAGFVLGLGYEWWIADQWGIGVMGRVAVAGATSEDANGIRWEHGVAAAPSVLFTATFN